MKKLWPRWVYIKKGFKLKEGGGGVFNLVDCSVQWFSILFAYLIIEN